MTYSKKNDFESEGRALKELGVRIMQREIVNFRS